MPFPTLVVLRCRDIEKSHAFYTLLGLTFAPHTHATGPRHYAHESPPHNVLELYPATPNSPPDTTALGFTVDATTQHSLHTTLSENGHAPTPVTDTPWGKSFVVRDPDKRRVEITTPI